MADYSVADILYGVRTLEEEEWATKGVTCECGHRSGFHEDWRGFCWIDDCGCRRVKPIKGRKKRG